ncbi:MAG: hydantoinase/oxoprolinase family protein [Gemmatimonadetes bacterium]|jgi:N-methylhydantoinase A/oxoprolinase/acetone carboxylase beta subunit|nr:hydantoinase/oxoprolinase family protein [Gemmatimonadota bacterium]MBT6144402.1 hydantoinase/oxoprolinase family protein [Gemmatimonadota bacterium]MBT7864101.1 hydantoinase/oxoprolinase family protein [Gemmatimonadota bacterium]
MSADKPLALGIDTGGTYTDAALVTHPGGDVVSTAKALTTPQDLSIGVSEALHRALDGAEGASDRIRLVGLSTTLATNAIVEGRGHAACLVLIGYDPVLIQRFGLGPRFITDDVVHIDGGHDGGGTQRAPFDEDALRRIVTDRLNRVGGFAVSSYFSVRNPEHELRARQIIEEISDGQIPVTCGHELSARLDSVRRATTTALNARLIPLLRDLIQTVRRTLDTSGIGAPLMVVKGDGSLVAADWALSRPVETILSGPAASVVGAWHLGGRGDGWVVDVGGTTTDIAVLRGGLPRLDAEGARVGGWQTMVETVHVRTAGLGGDSHVRYDHRRRPEDALQVGPRRVVPLSLLASEHDGVHAELRRQLSVHREGLEAGQFGLALGQGNTIPDRTRAIWQQLGDRPVSLARLVDASQFGALILGDVDTLESHRALQRSAFTPTDALHVLGHYTPHDVEAAQLGARLLGAPLGLTAEAFSARVVSRLDERLVRELVAKVLGDEGNETEGEDPLLDRVVRDGIESDLTCELTLQLPVIAVGAPVAAYMPSVAETLHTELVVPPHAHVANAVGAVAGGVVQHIRVSVRPTEREGVFHASMPQGTWAVASIEEGVAMAQKQIPDLLHERMVDAGAENIEIRVARDDHTAPLKGGWGQRALIETALLFTAVGTPATHHQDSA